MKLDLDLIADYFTILTSPSRWICNESYCKQWDKKLNELMQNNKFILVNNYEAKLGEYKIWIENDPYASFTVCDYNFKSRYRASRLTILRAGRKLNNDILEYIDSANKVK
jgi:hypothetical protein